MSIEELLKAGKRYENVLMLVDSKLPGLEEEKKEFKLDECMSLKQLETLMQWKLRRGKFRPRLMSLISSNAEKNVEQVTKEAFQLSGLRERVKKLCELRGVGPATASAILSCVDWDGSPFMSDEGYEYVMKKKCKYSLKEYIDYVAKMKEMFDGESLGDVEVGIFCKARGPSKRDQPDDEVEHSDEPETKRKK